MKTRSKALLLALCAVVLVVATVFGTIAYLTDREEVVNTFTVGSVSISMDESRVNTMGQPLTAEGKVAGESDTVQRVTGVAEGATATNTYHLLPGHTYTKDPIIYINDNETTADAYLYVKLEIGDNADLKALLGKYNLDDDLWSVLTGSTKDDWTALAVNGYNDGSGNYLLTYKTTVNKDTTDIKLFESITVPYQFTNEDLAKLDQFKITVTAYAVQVDGFEDTKNDEGAVTESGALKAWNATFGANTGN